jgi:GT2 family glycosyltransferase
VLRLNQNYGFAFAVNRGVESASAEFVAILNSDVRLDAGWLSAMAAGIGNKTFATGKVLSAAEPDTIDGAWDAVCRGGTALRCGAGRPDGEFWSISRSIVFPPLTAALIHRERFLGLGGLDEAFVSYLEDVEFGLRCASKGYTGYYIPAAVSYHLGSATLGRWNAGTVKQIARNQLFLIARHYPPELLREYGFRIAVAQLLWWAVAVRQGRGLAWLRGKWEGIRNFRRLRRPGSAAVREVLENSEREIREIQAFTGADKYWQIYLALAGK